MTLFFRSRWFFLVFLVLTGFMLACKSNKPESIKEENGYRLVWSDEFNDDGKPDSANWSYEYGFVRNQELQWYQPENALCDKGSLIITARQEAVANDDYDPSSNNWKLNRRQADYTSACLHSRGKVTFKYGMLEVRAKIDTTQGLWPAIWTLGEEKPWPSNGEVDLMEFYRSEQRPVIMANAAWGDHWSDVKWDSEKLPLKHFTDQKSSWVNSYHIWKMIWTNQAIKLYLDDELLNEIDITKTLNSDGYNPFHQPHYILLNLAVGSNGGEPQLWKEPKIYQVDYVRVYAKI
ncbi:glycoside hydrolase family 16 protein [Fulvivirga sediminis]|uniref:Glycoside hydrolase family 16 protein n=1 Tax=Fulvivirga sediminis TaxID=2803949 RepID=A0A937JZJ3_9BACT|nr:glycoside hydrolase family 16 protein [Fulvivirga sediminis]MBL3655345.1 glycoside hydrolase family 16 protein [Fulvivirga sediminis]